MKKIFYSLFSVCLVALSMNANAKIWRVNNIAGADADFTQVSDAVNSASVMNGDTIHVEPSAVAYSGFTSSKQLVMIGTGFFLDPAVTAEPANTGLQATVNTAVIGGGYLNATAAGSKFLGIRFSGQLNIGAATSNVYIERCCFTGGLILNNGGVNYTNIIIRKCFFGSYLTAVPSGGSLSDLTLENNMFYGGNAYLNLSGLTGSNNIIRNNILGGYSLIVPNSYLANNIHWAPTGWSLSYDFTNAVVKNNIFSNAPALPSGQVNNQLNIDMNAVFVMGTGSLDSRYQLKSGSPAIGAGVTVGGITPDCGMFGGTDPYILSGIPNIPTIYSLTVPGSIPSGQATMNVTFSTRNNN